MNVTEEDLKQLQGMGKGVPEIAFYYDLNPSEVVDKIKQLDVDGFDLQRKVPNGELLERLYVGREWSGVDIAERFNCAYKSVYRQLEQHGIDTRDLNDAQQGGPQHDELTPAYIASKVEQGYTIQQMADDLGVSYPTVARWKSRWQREGQL